MNGETAVEESKKKKKLLLGMYQVRKLRLKKSLS